jgi:indolepyruvate ferredoxin oxidoreductase alpha subunit
MKKILSGNEALALGAYRAGVKVAAAYPGTPSTEILENIAFYPDIHAEWSTNEKVAMEVAIGACYAGVRAMASMKHVGLNVASDAFLAAAGTGVRGGLVVVTADDPGMHSSQNEQDNRLFARLAEVALLEPADSQECYEYIQIAFQISEQFDTPVLLRTTTRISHSKSVVSVDDFLPETRLSRPVFITEPEKLVLLPQYARKRHPLARERIVGLMKFGDTFPCNREISGSSDVGIICSGVAFQYAMEAFPDAGFLKLALSYPLPENLIREFASRYKKLVIVEELEPFIEEQIRAMGICVSGKEYIPRTGELNTDVLRDSGLKAGWSNGDGRAIPVPSLNQFLPARPPLFCPGCSHTGLFFTLGTLAARKSKTTGEPGLVITGDIGCYTLGAYPPFSAMDSCGCMGAGIGQAQGIGWAGVKQKIVALIGDSTFMHSGITSLVNAVYNNFTGTVVILDNGTTAMTGHQPHPASGMLANGGKGQKVELEAVVRGIGVKNLSVVDAFDLKALRAVMKEALDSPELNVIIVRGTCAVASKKAQRPLRINEACDGCGVCLRLGCQALQKIGTSIGIDTAQCISCTLCQQVCPQKAIVSAES